MIIINLKPQDTKELSGKQYFRKARIKSIGGATMIVAGGLGTVGSIYVLQDVIPLAFFTALGNFYLAKVGYELMREASYDRMHGQTIDEIVMHGSSDKVLSLSPTDFIRLSENVKYSNKKQHNNG